MSKEAANTYSFRSDLVDNLLVPIRDWFIAGPIAEPLSIARQGKLGASLYAGAVLLTIPAMFAIDSISKHEPLPVILLTTSAAWMATSVLAKGGSN